MPYAEQAASAALSFPDALQVSQAAPSYLEERDGEAVSIPISILPTTESSELWITHERMILSCLCTSDDKSAHLCLERLIKRFGASNERIMGLRGLYQEAVAENRAGLEQISKEYDELLREDPTNMASAAHRSRPPV